MLCLLFCFVPGGGAGVSGRFFSMQNILTIDWKLKANLKNELVLTGDNTFIKTLAMQ